MPSCRPCLAGRCGCQERLNTLSSDLPLCRRTGRPQDALGAVVQQGRRLHCPLLLLYMFNCCSSAALLRPQDALGVDVFMSI